MSTWKRDAASGLVVVVPVLVTLYIIYWVFSNIAGFGPLQTVRNPLLRVGLALVIFVLVVFAIGYLMRTAVGRYLEDALDDAMNRLPGLRIVYNASKMAVETALNGTEEFQSPVKVETWEGMRMTAFRTGKRTADGRALVFIPTSPNITTGFVVEVDPDDVIETDETAENALTRVLSAGFGDSQSEGAARRLATEPTDGVRADGDADDVDHGTDAGDGTDGDADDVDDGTDGGDGTDGDADDVDDGTDGGDEADEVRADGDAGDPNADDGNDAVSEDDGTDAGDETAGHAP